MKGQSLVVDHDLVEGVLGGFVKIKWNFTKEAQSDLVTNTRLFLGPPVDGETLYFGLQLTKSDLAKQMFDGRIEAIWKEPQYTLTLSNLSLSDQIMVTLAINSRIKDSLKERDVVSKSVQVKVKGMHFLCKIAEIVGRLIQSWAKSYALIALLNWQDRLV